MADTWLIRTKRTVLDDARAMWPLTAEAAFANRSTDKVFKFWNIQASHTVLYSQASNTADYGFTAGNAIRMRFERISAMVGGQNLSFVSLDPSVTPTAAITLAKWPTSVTLTGNVVRQCSLVSCDSSGSSGMEKLQIWSRFIGGGSANTQPISIAAGTGLALYCPKPVMGPFIRGINFILEYGGNFYTSYDNFWSTNGDNDADFAIWNGGASTLKIHRIGYQLHNISSSTHRALGFRLILDKIANCDIGTVINNSEHAIKFDPAQGGLSSSCELSVDTLFSVETKRRFDALLAVNTTSNQVGNTWSVGPVLRNLYTEPSWEQMAILTGADKPGLNKPFPIGDFHDPIVVSPGEILGVLGGVTAMSSLGGLNGANKINQDGQRAYGCHDIQAMVTWDYYTGPYASMRPAFFQGLN